MTSDCHPLKRFALHASVSLLASLQPSSLSPFLAKPSSLPALRHCKHANRLLLYEPSALQVVLIFISPVCPMRPPKPTTVYLIVCVCLLCVLVWIHPLGPSMAVCLLRLPRPASDRSFGFVCVCVCVCACLCGFPP
jgi:hypothetical protein